MKSQRGYGCFKTTNLCWHKHEVSRRRLGVISMKIDIHTHTRKCKSGDASTREISPADFCETIISTDVGIVAITNHNVFDLSQFEEITRLLDLLGDNTQVWPGIELDVRDGDSKGHLIVIVSPKLAKEFSFAIENLTKDSNPDTFTATIDDVLESLDVFQPIYVAHYNQKKPNLTDEALSKLEAGVHKLECVLKEVTNSISAGIYISHGHSSIYGSDVHDWKRYEELSHDLPDLRLPVESFEHFCLLLKKDPTAINTVLDQKTPEELILKPFGDGEVLTVKAYNDINVIFGSKGTGKSCILKAIERHYSDRGIDAKLYESASDRLDEIFDVKGRGLRIDLNTYGINYCTSEIESLLLAREVAITSLSKYVVHFAASSTSRNAKKILLKDMDPEEEGRTRHEFEEFNEAKAKTNEFLAFAVKNPSFKKVLSESEFTELDRILGDLSERLRSKVWASFSEWKEISLLNHAIGIFRTEVGRKTGRQPKPLTTGFKDYALNRMRIEMNAAEIIKNIETAIPVEMELVGNLGPNKGDLYFRTEFIFQTGSITDGSLMSLASINKGPKKSFANCVRRVLQHAYSDDLFEHISTLNAIEGVEAIKTVHELLLFKRHFVLDGLRYSPSSGEASMVMLQKELKTDKDVYILDEPERSLGNEYINDVIVPMIKNHARAGRKIFISTHDANIAVRTLPYSSIYRCHEKSGYKTYIGNPFTNNLVNPEDSGDHLDWKKISMKTLEGGEEAFGERGKIYGHN